MRVRLPIDGDGTIGPRWGRAPRVAVAEVADGAVVDWAEYAVGWDQSHDTGSVGAHHACVARFLRDSGVQVVAVGRRHEQTISGGGR